MSIFTFYDCISGGICKLPWACIHIEAESREAATAKFDKIFGFSHWSNYCECCTGDYDMIERPSVWSMDDDDLQILAGQEDLTANQILAVDMHMLTHEGVYRARWEEREGAPE